MRKSIQIIIISAVVFLAGCVDDVALVKSWDRCLTDHNFQYCKQSWGKR